MDIGLALVEEHRPWLHARKATIEPSYAPCFHRLLERKGWPQQVIATLDRVTDDILDLLGDPTMTGPWTRRGLVVGDVQSGKTATYTGLCCKAGDVGYRLIILLTGTLESLRRQTQERLDEGFVGLDSSGELTKVRTTRAVGVGLIPGHKGAGVFTSRVKDFNKTLLNALGFRLNGFLIPVLVVVKKNKRILENLEKWLYEFNAEADGKIRAPVLVIDDEADSASVNTRKPDEDPTEINRRIRSLLKLFTHSNYIGFTATPFANVFIDPDTEDDMLGNDLFPKDFIYNLEAPSNYFGPQLIFGEEPLQEVLRAIDDADVIFPYKHKSELKITTLPTSLLEAVRTFLLATTIRDLRDEGATHRSMLINVSRFTAVQDKIAALVHTWLSKVHQDIRNYSQLDPSEALHNENIAALRATWEREFAALGIPWPSIQLGLLAGALPVVVKAVNQRTGAASLDYARHREHGLRVIAVGGNSLSRGLTLEGLSTSYFFRNSQMYDTLLQMGRWFGYRDGYDDLCRLWLTDDAVHWYSHITMATDELRGEFRRMHEQSAKPKDFGLKVRAHPDALIVTAQNKMRRSKLVERVISISGESLETPRLKTNENVLLANWTVIERFVDALRTAGRESSASPWGNPFWEAVPKSFVIDVLRGFDVHPLNISFQANDLASYLERTPEVRLQYWDVVFPQGKGDLDPVAGVALTRNIRKVRVDPTSILVSGRSARVASRGIEREGLSPTLAAAIAEEYRQQRPGKSVPDSAFRKRRSRPLLLVHVIQPTTETEGEVLPKRMVALGLSFPVFDDTDVAKRVLYRVSIEAWDAMLDNEIDEDLTIGGDDDQD